MAHYAVATTRTMRNSARLGIGLMILTSFVFALQDGVSRYLAEHYSVLTVVMLRYWFFAAFVVALSASRGGGIRRVARSGQPILQIFRGVLLAAEVCVMVLAFVLLGLIESHAVFAIYPLSIAALSGPVLGERVGWRRWTAIGIGLVGVLVILRPGFRVFEPEALVPLAAALMFALYGLLTRRAAQTDSAETSFFYTGVAGAAAISLVGPFFWDPMQNPTDWAWMIALCISGAFGHFLLIKTYEVAEASVVQPFAYFQLLFVTILGLTLFGEALDPVTAAGGGLILAAGVYTIWRTGRKSSVGPASPMGRSG
jgi:drug/metabolite transporter (DMT)-like permease